MNNRLLLGLAPALFGLFGAPASATTLTYTDFSNVSGLSINGNAAQAGNVLRVTPANFGQGGSVFSTNTVSLAANVSFSTAFSFRFSNPGGAFDGQGLGADGLVFVLQTSSNSVGGSGGGIGYAGLANSFGIEFDTWNNGFGDHDSSNHIGIDINGNMNSVALTHVTEADMNNGNLWNAWIDYNGTTLEARLSQSSIRPTDAIVSYTGNLADILGSTNAFVGFTSGTGAAFANHDVLSWTFVDTFAPIDENNVPEPSVLGLIGLGFAGMGYARRRKSVQA